MSDLPICPPKFVVPAPQFDCCVKDSEEFVQIVFLSLPSGLMSAGRFLSACLLFHLDFLQGFLSPSHPLLLVSFFTSKKLAEMKKSIIVKYAWEEDDDFEIVGTDGVSKSGAGVQEDFQSEESNQVLASLEGVLGGCQVVPQVGTVGSLQIRKATGIPPHVMLLASMQKVINSQHFFLVKMKEIINSEFDKRELGHATFQVQKQVEQMLVSFESNVIKKLETFGATSKNENSSSNESESSPTRNHTGGKWYHWGGKYRRVPHDWEFPNKMTLRTAWHWWFLEDHKNQVCPLRYLTSTDLHNCKNGRRNISSMKTLMNAMVSEAKKKNVYVDKPTEEQVGHMFQVASGKLFSLTENKRAETLSWHTYIRYLNIKKKKEKSNCNTIVNV